MLSGSCKSASEASGESKVLVFWPESPKLLIMHYGCAWTSGFGSQKTFLMYNFSAADQSTAAGHEDAPTPPPPPPSHILGRTLAPASVSETPAALDLDDSGLFPSQGSLQLSRVSPSPLPLPTTHFSSTHFAALFTVPLEPPPTPPSHYTHTHIRLLTPVFAPPGPCLGH